MNNFVFNTSNVQSMRTRSVSCQVNKIANGEVAFIAWTGGDKWGFRSQLYQGYDNSGIHSIPIQFNFSYISSNHKGI